VSLGERNKIRSKGVYDGAKDPAFERSTTETRMMIRNGVAVLSVGLAFAGSALAQNAPAKKKGGMMTNNAGMTRTHSTRMRAARARATDLAPAAGRHSWQAAMSKRRAIGRSSPATTAASNGRTRASTLYLWSKDQTPADMTGDGFNGIWHVVKD
jgi:predicted lipoprotein with Yx(FWY)xxD motif